MKRKTDEAAAELHARRFYKQDHFSSLVHAERAYFRVLAEWSQRGQQIAALARKLCRARLRANTLTKANHDLQQRSTVTREQLRVLLKAAFLEGFSAKEKTGHEAWEHCATRHMHDYNYSIIPDHSHVNNARLTHVLPPIVGQSHSTGSEG